MTIEKIIEDIKGMPHFEGAVNLKTHLHIISLYSFRVLSYFNQPVVVEVNPSVLHGSFRLLDKSNNICLPFPCMEVFCPSFNAKTSLFVDFYKVAHGKCVTQFDPTFGLPTEFYVYNPTSIRCEH